MPKRSFDGMRSLGRKARVYEVVLAIAGETAQTVTERVRCYWNPDFKDAIKDTAVVQAWWNSGKTIECAAIEIVGWQWEDEIAATGAPA